MKDMGERKQGWLSRCLRGKESACQAGDEGPIPGSGRSPGEGNGNPFSTLAWRIPEEPGGLPSMGSQGIGHDRAMKQQQRSRNR